MTRTAYKTVKTTTPETPPVPLLTYRPSKSGTVIAVYRGSVRVGYVTHSPSTRAGSKSPPWTWELNLLRPEGGNYVGRAASEEFAKMYAEQAFKYWMTAAQLTLEPETTK